MSQENRGRDEEMRPEYDIRGGVRGKYFQEYVATQPRVTISTSPFIVTTNAGGEDDSGLERSFVAPPMIKSPELIFGTQQKADRAA